MRIGVPLEVKPLEGRVGLIPPACADLVAAGHRVLVQAGAGRASGFSDDDYRRLGVEVVPDAEALYGQAELVVKVKEPVAEDLRWLRRDHLLFCYLHLAANPELACRLRDIGLTAIAFETVQDDSGLPLLAPMSDIAGRIAAQVGTHLLHAPQGGKGLLLGGLPGARRGQAVVVGAGTAGGAAATVLAALGARVTVFDRRRERLEVMRALGNGVTALYPYADELEAAVRDADLLVGAVLIPGARAPRVVSRAMVAAMGPGSVVVDISVDQGGCIETTRPTDYRAPTYLEAGVLHFAVTNMPGGVPRTASEALSAALTPYVLRLAGGDWADDPALARGLNLQAGEILHPAVADAVGDACERPDPAV